MNIPLDFETHYNRKKGSLARDPLGPQLKMTLEEYWAKWQQHWQNRQNGPNTLLYGETMVMGRYGDQGDYTVDNCRVITHRENTLERDHTKCAEKLRGTVNNPQGGRTVPKHRNGGAPILTPRGEYPNCAEAAQAYGMHRSSIWHRVNSDAYPDFYWRNF